MDNENDIIIYKGLAHNAFKLRHENPIQDFYTLMFVISTKYMCPLLTRVKGVHNQSPD